MPRDAMNGIHKNVNMQFEKNNETPSATNPVWGVYQNTQNYIGLCCIA